MSPRTIQLTFKTLTTLFVQSLTLGTSRSPSGRSLHQRMPGTQLTSSSLTPDTRGGQNYSEMSSKTWRNVGNTIQITFCRERSRSRRSSSHSRFSILFSSDANTVKVKNFQRQDNLIIFKRWQLATLWKLKTFKDTDSQVAVTAEHRLSSLWLNLIVGQVRGEKRGIRRGAIGQVAAF